VVFPVKRCIGLDVHKHTIYATELYPDASRRQYEFQNNEKGLSSFEQSLKPEDRIALEATTNAFYLCRRFMLRGCEVLVANPMKIHQISRSNAKTDRNDSDVLAKLLSVGLLPTVWVPDPETQALRDLLQERNSLVGHATRIQNRIRALLTAHGLTCSSSDLRTRYSDLFLCQVQARLPKHTREKLDSLLRQLESVDSERRRLHAFLRTDVAERPDVELLCSIPGVSVILAAIILAAIGTIERFPNPHSLANYAGLVPRVRSSAHKAKHGSITKAGSRDLRWALNQAVHQLVRQPGPFQAMYRRLVRRKNKACLFGWLPNARA